MRNGTGMKYGSVCSGIEAATVAWHPLGWEPSFYSEIEKFPRAVLQHHYPDVPLHGDFTTIQENDYDPIELLVGGTPCQSFSIAGLRKGLDDDRGNLALEYLKLAQRKRPKWLVWENVPGVLSSNGGRDFGAFLGGLGELGYGFAYRVLDAQYFGVAQRRRRVFVIGYFGDWRPPAAVLFEQESLCGHPKPSREAKQDIAGTITAGLGRRRGAGQEPETIVSAQTSPTLRAQPNSTHRADSMAYVAHIPTTHRMRGFGDYELDSVASALKSRDYKDATDLVCVHGTQDPCVSDQAFALGRNNGQENAIAIQTAHTGSNGCGVSEDNIAYTLDQAQGQAVAFAQNSRDELRIQGGDGQITGALSANEGMKQRTYIAQPYSIMPMNSGNDYKARETDIAQPLMAAGPTGGNQGGDFITMHMQVRRLTPVECERLQGFPDSYTAIPWRNKSAEQCPDGPRYKALGNSMAVPVMHWLGQRIEMVDQLLKQLKVA